MTDERLYVDVHVLQTVPPANLNRDDNGNPKESMYGGVRRSRVSSQAWKRATRKRFAGRTPKEQHGTRTKTIAARLAERLQTRAGLEAEPAQRLANALLVPLGIKPGKKAGDTAYLLFFGYNQLDAIIDKVAGRAADLTLLPDTELTEALKSVDIKAELATGHPVDVALFGRMVADIASLNVDAAVQVAHAVSTHAVDPEFDYFTAVDDENTADETGAGMIGRVGFNAATLYRYATVNVPQLEKNLGDQDQAVAAVAGFIEDFARSVPSGYQNSFAHQTLPHLVAVVVRGDQPVNLVTAFEYAVASEEGLAQTSALRLAQEYSTSVDGWGDTPLHTAVFHTFDEKSPAAHGLAEAFTTSPTFPGLLAGVTFAVWPKGPR
ncbi:type I-E CRISPR-associated protein Cas7/Cse4/CasC [Embleya sp. AB8]|uniref:type I-E CRISPR-associated protein Cas7/Cse4/CasC n=1 Tax=Embleya sp. AB8 TaxID=3156304 RepID=UPI003C749385